MLLSAQGYLPFYTNYFARSAFSRRLGGRKVSRATIRDPITPGQGPSPKRDLPDMSDRRRRVVVADAAIVITITPAADVAAIASLTFTTTAPLSS